MDLALLQFVVVVGLPGKRHRSGFGVGFSFNNNKGFSALLQNLSVFLYV